MSPSTHFGVQYTRDEPSGETPSDNPLPSLNGNGDGLQRRASGRGAGADAESLIRNLGRASQGEVKVPGSPYPLAKGWVDVQTKEGVVIVNPAQVAYVRDIPD